MKPASNAAASAAALFRGGFGLPLAGTLAIVVMVATWQIGEGIHARYTIAPDLRAELDCHCDLSVAVKIAVKPERFHTQYFARLAPYGGRVKGTTYYFPEIASDVVEEVGRQYWVNSITKWSGD